jgi:hypothetical protein
MNGRGLLSHPPDPDWLKKLRKGGRPVGALSDAERRSAQRLVAAGLLPVEALRGFPGALSGAEMRAAQGMLAPAMQAGTPMPPWYSARLDTSLPPFGGMSTRDRALGLLGGMGRR